MATMNGKPVRALLDGGASCSDIWAPLVPPPPKDALKYTSSGVHCDGKHSLTSVTAGGKTHMVPTLVFDNAKVDRLNHPDFDDLWEQAKHDQLSINAVFTHQQTRETINEDNQLDDQQRNYGVPSTSISEILGDDYYFLQTNGSLRISDSLDYTNLPSFAKAQKHDRLFDDLWLQAD